MALTQHCSNVLYNYPINTKYDFTASFTYSIDTGGFNPSNNYGFSIFFINGSSSEAVGGGCAEGLGIIDPAGSSYVGGLFLAAGFDFTGNFTAKTLGTAFTTGTPTPQPNSICIRADTYFLYISSIQYTDVPLFYPIEADPVPWSTQTIRVGVRSNFQYLDLYFLNNQTYQKLATFKTNLTTIPASMKFGIGYSGDTLFQVKNITMNYT
jgi:hypothetical protein